MYAQVDLKSTHRVDYRQKFSASMTIEAPDDVITVPDFVARLQTMGLYLHNFNLLLTVQAVLQGVPALDGSPEGQQSRMVAEARLAQFILEQGLRRVEDSE